MKHSSKMGIFPWLTIAAGVTGFFMQCWLFSDLDTNGLLPRYHFASIMSFVLLALTLAVCWIGTREEKNLCPHKPVFSSTALAAGIGLGAIGIAFSAFTVNGVGILQFLTVLCGILAAAALGYIAFCRFKDLHADCMPYCVIIVYLILRTMTNCSSWSAEPQFQRYFFPLLACVLLMTATYYRAALALSTEHSKRYVFFSQAALFCCILCCRGSDWLFYLSAALWLTFDRPVLSAATADICDE